MCQGVWWSRASPFTKPPREIWQSAACHGVDHKAGPTWWPVQYKGSWSSSHWTRSTPQEHRCHWHSFAPWLAVAERPRIEGSVDAPLQAGAGVRHTSRAVCRSDVEVLAQTVIHPINLVMAPTRGRHRRDSVQRGADLRK